MKIVSHKLFIAAFLLCSFVATSATAELFINEIMFDPPSNSGDGKDEYIEIRGLPNQSLANHYLIFLEGEITNAGLIDNIFDLGAYTTGSNGFLSIRQKDFRYQPEQINPLGNNLVNAGPDLIFGADPGFGSGANSTVGHTDEGGNGRIENGAFTAMLIRNASGAAPVVGEDLDLGNDGLDVPTGKIGWQVLDAVAIAEEDETLTARSYAPINFGARPVEGIPNGFQPLIEPGATFVVLPFEIEYLGRWGNSTGQTAADWHVSNITDNPGSGFIGGADYRQSGATGTIPDHPASDGNPATPAPQVPILESSKNVPYGTRLTDTIGGPNFITGDFTGDGYVDIADYTVWRDTFGQTGPGGLFPASESDHPAADPNHDFVVDSADYALWAANFGQPGSSGSSLSFSRAIPEPTAGILVSLIGAVTAMGSRGRRQN
ncbi:hypothetical protein [Botrimarina hoheduenensis]|nr:hypothetical protein [Botrimarina hoheduenensis]